MPGDRQLWKAKVLARDGAPLAAGNMTCKVTRRLSAYVVVQVTYIRFISACVSTSASMRGNHFKDMTHSHLETVQRGPEPRVCSGLKGVILANLTWRLCGSSGDTLTASLSLLPSSRAFSGLIRTTTWIEWLLEQVLSAKSASSQHKAS